MKILKLSLAVCVMAFLNIYCGVALNLDYSRTTYYVSSSGSASGKGTSWDDALNTESFVDVLMKMDSVHACTFYLTKGTYVLQDSDGKLVYANLGKNVTIRGGYSPSGLSDGYSPDNKTIFMPGGSLNYTISFCVDPNAFLSLYDIYFEGRRDQASSTESTVGVTIYSNDKMESELFHVERCSFSNGCYCTVRFCSGTFNQCDFDFSMGGSLSVDGGGNMHPFNVLSSSFSGVSCLHCNSDNELRVENCNFVGYDGKLADSDVIYIGPSSTASEELDPMAVLVHNTILGGVQISGVRNWMNGNFIDGTFTVDSRVNIDSLPQCNLYVRRTASDWNLIDAESWFAPNRLSYLFDYESGVYSVKEAKDQRTKYIKLKKDAYALSEDECFLFRVPLVDKNALRKDHLGQDRYSAPCFGAYEYPFVVRKDYYVKNGGEGDGSSWKRAMGSSDFFNYFQIAPTSSTFHIAEGLYTPRQIPVGSRRGYPCFFTRRYVNLQGGYPPSPKDGDRPKPFVYHTVFSGDSKREDILDDDDKAGDLVTILNYFLPDGGEATVSGIDFRWQSNHPKCRDCAAAEVEYALAMVEKDKLDSVMVKFNFEKCSFSKCSNGIYSDVPTLNVKECSFDRIDAAGVESFSTDNLNVESCTFHNCTTGVIASYAKNMRAYNSTFLQNNQAFYFDVPSEGSLTLANNTVMDDSYVIMSSAEKSKVNMVGNIIPYPMEGKANITEASIKEFKSTNNLFLSDYLNELKPSANMTANDFTTISDFYSVVQNTMFVGGSQLPVLSYENSDFPPTIPLSSDMTQDSIDLRFPLENTPVNTDQWGNRRGARTCMGAYEFQGEYPFIPSAFTPYSPNGKNDIFMKGYEVYIYNRYGLLLCHSRNGWDGSYKGKLVEPGVYVYVVVTRVENRKGTVEVIKSK